MVKKEIVKVLQRFVKGLKEENIRIDKIILYGSMTTGKAHKYSDIDIAVVSPDFGRDRFEEGVRLRHIASHIDLRIEPVPISLKAYKEDTWLPLIYEIRTKGRELEWN